MSSSEIRSEFQTAESGLRKGQSQLLLQLENLHKAFGGQSVLRGVEGEVHEGDFVLLRGDTGAGKTTLLNLISGFVSADQGAITLDGDESSGDHQKSSQQLHVETGERFGHIRSGSRRIVGRAWQDIRLFSSLSLKDNIAVATTDQLGENPLQVLFRPARVRTQENKTEIEAIQILKRIRLDDREESRGDSISLGESRRLSIARACRGNPKLLLLDEPLSGLDNFGIAETTGFLEELSASGMTLIVVEHLFNIPALLRLATVVWTLDSGRIRVESPREVEQELAGERPRVDFTDSRKLSFPNSKVSHQSLDRGAELIKISRQIEGRLRPILEVENLILARNNQVIAVSGIGSQQVHGLSFNLCEGEIGILCAKNGWGKSTLMETLVGILKPLSGTIRFEGRSVDSVPTHELCKSGIGFLQSRGFSFSSLTVLELLRLSGVHDRPEELGGLYHKRMGSLSGGEKRRVAIACHYNKQRHIMLLDEPFAALDSKGISWIWNAILKSPWKACLIAVPSTIGLELEEYDVESSWK